MKLKLLCDYALVSQIASTWNDLALEKVNIEKVPSSHSDHEMMLFGLEKRGMVPELNIDSCYHSYHLTLQEILDIRNLLLHYDEVNNSAASCYCIENWLGRSKVLQ